MWCGTNFHSKPSVFVILPGIIFLLFMTKFGFFMLWPLGIFLVIALMSGKHHHRPYIFPSQDERKPKPKNGEKRKNDSPPTYIRTSDGEWLEVVDSTDDAPIDTV